MESLTHSMAELDHESAEYAAVAERYQRLDHEFRTRDGYAIEAQVGMVLTGLGFHKDDWSRQTDEFSGGWQMRISLAKLLLQKPNLLLLDEPTNHLDLESRNWLEDYLRNYPFAFVLISHDRYFLDVTVRKTLEIWNKRIHLLLGKLRQVSGRQNRAPRTTRSRVQKSARAHRATRSLHQPLPLPGHQGQASPEPHQGTREDRADRDSGRRKDHPLLFPAAKAQRADRRRIYRRRQELRLARKSSAASTS